MATQVEQVKYQVEGMDCANCALTLERSLAQIPGLEQVEVNFSTAALNATGHFDPQAVISRVEALGYHVVEPGSSSQAARPVERVVGDGPLGFFRYLLNSRNTALAIGAALLLVAALGIHVLLPGWPLTKPLQFFLEVAAALLAGTPIALRGARALWVGRQITIDFLMTIAAVGALLIGETGEAATVIMLFAIGEALEGYTADRARASLRSLLALKPEQAHVQRPCMDCAEHLGQDDYTGGPCPFCGVHETTVPVEQVQIGELVLVRPGERIPVDGVIHSGASSINQAPVTGESLPVLRSPGEEVFAGTLNGEAALEIRVTHLAQDSTISRIVRLVEEAQSRRTPAERFIDRFAAWYTPAVVLTALLLAVLPPLLFGAPFLDLADGTRGWLYRALALLIVACPCALVISTPVTVVSALTALARRGVLVKGGVFLDVLARVRVFAFDKTGTLTNGTPVVMQTLTLDCPPGTARCEACDDMLALASAVERRSQHPLAQAIVTETQQRQLEHVYPAASEVTALTGRGVHGLVNGSLLTVGSHALSHAEFEEHEDLHVRIEAAEAQGQTVMLVSQDEKVLGFVGVADSLRPSSQAALRALKEMDPGCRLVMLTGDAPGVAQKIAASVGGIDDVRAGLLPDDKLETVRRLQAQYGPTAMVGDGVNDAPALAAASVGVAMGGAGTAQAMETADVVLMQDNLGHLPDAVQTSRRARGIIMQNIIFSLAVKVVFLALSLPGWTTLWMAVFADMGASLLVTMNGLRMLRPAQHP